VTGSLCERGGRADAWLCIVAIGIISLLPAANFSPVRTSIGGHAEHLLTYAATTLVTLFAYLEHSRFKIGLSLIAYAAVLEYLQRYSPVRPLGAADLAFSTTGVIFGLVNFHFIQTFWAPDMRGANEVTIVSKAGNKSLKE
jgi:VanZ family protein